MSILKVDTINEKTSGNGVAIPGHVIQFKTATSTGSGTIISSAGGSFVSLAGLSLSFTPKVSTSWLYITFSTHVFISQTASAWQAAEIKIFKDGTGISTAGTYGTAANHAGTNDRFMDYMYKHTVHVPASTSAATYDVRAQCPNLGGNDVQFNTSYGGGGRLVIMEISQ